MSQLTSYLGAQSTIAQPGEQLAGQIVRLMEQVRNGQDEMAAAVTQIQTVLDEDAALATPLLTAATITDVKAQLGLLKAGGTMANGKDAVGTDVVGTMISTIVGA